MNKDDFLQEITYYRLISDRNVVPCYGISQDSQGNHIMVMEYVKDGSLRKYLQNNYKRLEFNDKFDGLCQIALGLNSVHKQGLVHRDFHSGNVLSKMDIVNSLSCYVTDLGLCRPSNEESEEGKIYGVLPYVAPEVLKDKQYTQASDIYSFGIIAYELLAGSFPYRKYAHDSVLALRICEGLRPNLGKLEIPQLLKGLISQCWDADPAKRPTANRLSKILKDWWNEISEENSNYEEEGEISEFYEQYQEIEEEYNNFSKNVSYQIHPSAIYTSRRLDFKNLPEPKNSKEINDLFYSTGSIAETIEIGLNKIDLQDTAKEEQNSNQVAQIIIQKEPLGVPGSSKNN